MRKPNKPLIIGLTGPIASGKNEAAKMFSRRGAFVIDADEIGHKVIAPQTKAWRSVVKIFGVKVLSRGGKVNRKKLAKIAFASKSSLKKLTSVVHPEIKAKVRQMIAGSKRKVIVVNAAVLSEIGLLPLVDKVVVVLAKKSLRLRRLLKSGRSKADALARIRSQRSDSSYRKMADVVIVNNGSKKSLVEKVKRLLANITRD